MRSTIKFEVPDSSKQNANEKEDQTDHKHAGIPVLFQFLNLTLTVLCIYFVLQSAQRNNRQYDIPDNETDADQSALTADIHQAGKGQKQQSRDHEAV